ncbi:TPA: class I SAM-dependent methyltransferase [Candidatus Scatousia excrementigallinarum]|uniref:Class I SAM-dependent methyltransferase n=1 Tax=Candidatus Scatousia excrementigallinarum TaxID=2840935 RepID=A0A9D1EZ74_9BACT|nr:class I SAM-dependent methyltransferase [Candidatus Scatousia excrementigallinarum]
MTGFLNNIFSITNEDKHKCLHLLCIKFKWKNKAKLIEDSIDRLKDELVSQNRDVLQKVETDFKTFVEESQTTFAKNLQIEQQKFKSVISDSTKAIDNRVSEIKLKQYALETSLNSIKSELSDYSDKLLQMHSSMDYLATTANNGINSLKQHLLNIKNSNQIDFVYKNIDNPQYEFLYNDLYKIFSVGEYYSMRNIYVKRLNKFTIEQNIQRIKQKYTKDIYLLTDISEPIDICHVISVSDISSLQDKENTIFVLAYNQDFSGILAIKELQKYNLKYLSIEQYGTPQARYYHINENAYKTLLEESNNNPLQHFCPGDFENIFQALETTKNLEGDYVEIGTFQGASARATLNYRNKSNINKKCYFIDTYEGFSYAEAQNSQDMLWSNTHTETSIEKVNNYLADYDNYELIKSNIIQDELPEKIKNICAANIDVDMYEAVKAALYKVKDRLVKNGIVIAEDYGHTPALIGAQKAVDEFLDENPDEFIPIYLHSGQMFLIKR